MMLKISAIDILPGDRVNERKVVASIPNYLRKGQTEIRFDDGATEFFRNDRTVEIRRPLNRAVTYVRAKDI